MTKEKKQAVQANAIEANAIEAKPTFDTAIIEAMAVLEIDMAVAEKTYLNASETAKKAFLTAIADKALAKAEETKKEADEALMALLGHDDESDNDLVTFFNADTARRSEESAAGKFGKELVFELSGNGLTEQWLGLSKAKFVARYVACFGMAESSAKSHINTLSSRLKKRGYKMNWPLSFDKIG